MGRREDQGIEVEVISNMIQVRKRILLSSVMLLFLLALQVPGIAQHNRTDKNVLVLFSLAPSTPAYRPILDGIRLELSKAFGDSVNLRVEYLETDKYPKGEYPREKFEVYNKKYRDLKLDLLICVGIDIVSSVKAFADDHLLDLNTISIDYDLSGYGFLSDIRLNDRTTVIGIKVNAEKTIQTAVGLFPAYPNVIIICGMSRVDQMFCEISRQAVKALDNRKKVTHITDVSMDEAIKMLGRIPDSSIVIMPAFNQDAEQVPYYNPEAVRIFSRAARAPVFTFTQMGFGEGSLGGYLVSFSKVGSLAGVAAVNVLNGTDPNSITVKEDEYYGYMFDDRQLKRWGLSHSAALPDNTVIFFEETNFFQEYKYLIIVAAFFLLTQSFLIVRLIIMFRQQKAMTMALQQSESKYRELLREERILQIGQLTASLSHELNQPLTAILSTAQAGLRVLDFEENDKELLREILQNIVEDDKRTASILSSLRGMMKLEHREKEPFDLNEIIREMGSIYRSEMIDNDIMLEIKLPAEPVQVLADKPQIQQVLMNLIANAIYATKYTGKTYSRIILTEWIDGRTVVVSVRDFGKGIDKKLMPEIFKPFVTDKKDGMGIGLPICKSIIEAHSGRIWAENMPDGGAQFIFSLNFLRNEH